MATKNTELHRLVIDAVNRRDLDALLRLMDDDVEAVSRIAAVEGGLHGHDGIRRWWDEWFAAFPDYQMAIDEIRDLGDVTVAALRAVAHGAGSEVPLEDTIWQPARWEKDKCVWWRVCYSLDEALEAVGQAEDAADAAS
jgi:ketosteroid isomerase-like protein